MSLRSRSHVKASIFLTRDVHLFIHNYIRSLLNIIIRPSLMVRTRLEPATYCSRINVINVRSYSVYIVNIHSNTLLDEYHISYVYECYLIRWMFYFVVYCHMACEEVDI